MTELMQAYNYDCISIITYVCVYDKREWENMGCILPCYQQAQKQDQAIRKAREVAGRWPYNPGYLEEDLWEVSMANPDFVAPGESARLSTVEEVEV